MSNDTMHALMDDNPGKIKNILVLAKHDHAEAMRVAAGLTIFGHRVDLVFVDRVVEENAENVEQAELLELAEVEPLSLIDDPNMGRIDSEQLSKLILSCQHLISI